MLATRTDPALPLGALRARGQLLELRADELRFTAAEATEFLNERLQLGLDPADIAEVEDTIPPQWLRKPTPSGKD